MKLYKRRKVKGERRKEIPFYLVFGIFCLSTFAFCLPASAQDILDKEIQLPKTKETTYELLNRITDLTGFFFVYDGDMINSEKKVNFPGGQHTVRQSIYLITKDSNI